MIKVNDYKTIVNLLGNSIGYASDVDVLLSNITNIANSVVSRDPTSLNKSVLNSRKSLFINEITPSKQLLAFVLSLQKHVIKNYGSITSFYTNNNITVSSGFASLSAQVNIIIPPQFIIS